MRTRIRVAAILIPALLAGCGGPIINPYYYGGFEPSEAHSVKVVVSGEPVANSKADLPQAVVAAMQGHTAFQTDMALLPEGAVAPYRTVVMFNPPPGAATHLLCVQPLRIRAAPAPQEAVGRMPFSAALCRGDQVLSGAYGYMDRVPADDPRFQVAMADLARNLFPPQNPDAQLYGGGGVNRH